MADVLECKTKLQELANELNMRSDELAQTNRELEPIQAEWEEHFEDFEAGLYDECIAAEKRLPGADMRHTLALRALPTSFRGKHRELAAKRGRLEQRIRDIRVQIDAWRSLLSAEKAELEAIST